MINTKSQWSIQISSSWATNYHLTRIRGLVSGQRSGVVSQDSKRGRVGGTETRF